MPDLSDNAFVVKDKAQVYGWQINEFQYLNMKQDVNAIYVGKQSLSRNMISTHDYAQAFHLYQLLTEATKILLRKNGLTGNQVINEFLQQCNRGQHVLLKSYGSFNKSPLCKICFLHNFFKIFDVDQSHRNGLDYYQLSRLLCSDFPKEFIQRAVNLLLPNQEPPQGMYKVLQSKQFQQALYLQMIYTEYIDVLSTYFQQEEELDFLETYRIVKQEDVKNIKQLTKPPFSVVVQSLLNLMRDKGILAEQQAPVIFVTEENIEDFIRDAETNYPDRKVKLDELLRKILESREYAELVQENLSMFENSQTWANENHKLLSLREPHQTPLNVKKKATKK